MIETGTIERRCNPYAKQLLLLGTFATVIVFLIGFLPVFKPLAIPMSYLAPFALVYAVVLAVILYRQGTSDVPPLPALIGIILVVGGVAFDLIVTVTHSPNLSKEANPFVRLFLDSGYSLEFVYAYGFIFQFLFTLIICVLWIAFLRHRETLLASARKSNPKSGFAFLKAAMGGAHLSWRQFLIPLKLTDLPMSYHMTWLVVDHKSFDG